LLSKGAGVDVEKYQTKKNRIAHLISPSISHQWTFEYSNDVFADRSSSPARPIVAAYELAR